jgi:Glycosyl hydrolase family 79 C-terminal beta domain
MAAVRRRVGGIGVLAALVALVLVPSVSPASSTDPTLYASVGSTTVGQPIGSGFVGVSMEFQAVHAYTGNDPNAINPVLVSLLRGLAPGQQPVIRIGGDSTDQTWWPMRGVVPPGGITYTLNRDWLATTRALVQQLDAHLIIGVNLAAGRPSFATAEARAFLSGIGRRYIEAMEIGNEPDLYSQFVWYHAPDGKNFLARPKNYSFGDFSSQFAHWSSALPNVPVAGPALAELVWLGDLSRFVSAAPGLSVVTVHRYPLRGCIHDTTSPLYASIPNLLADSSSQGLAQDLAPDVSAVHDRGLQLRVDEMNSVACSGVKGVSNTFASALWAIDTLFNMASIGVDGVNFHTLPHAGYELFTFQHVHGKWEAFVHPEYYGMLMFEQAAPPGSRLLTTSAPSGPVKVWATQEPSGADHVVLINKSLTTSQNVQVTVPNASTASVEWLQAPSASSTSGVSLGGQTFGSETTSGTLSSMHDGQLPAFLGSYTIDVPPASAVMLTQP